MLIAFNHLWCGGKLVQDMAARCSGDIITDVRPLNDDTPDHRVHLAIPSLTDLQVNGGGGVMVNNTPTPDGILAVADAHRKLGTGTILPTVITDTADVIAQAGDAALQVMQDPRIGGLHIEGPHIAPARRGTHNEELIRPLDTNTVMLVEDLRKAGLPVMITLAPELADVDLLNRLVAAGAVVSAGHSAATAQQTEAALKRGLNCFTHLYNAMPPMTSRAPGILGAALNSKAFAGIIADGVHVSWDMIRIALRARPAPNLTFAVSDAMATVGGPDHFELYGQRIHVADGALINADGALAGAHIDLRQSFANLVQKVGLSLEEAIPMVTDIPRHVMSMSKTEVQAGTALADLLFLDSDLELAALH